MSRHLKNFEKKSQKVETNTKHRRDGMWALALSTNVQWSAEGAAIGLYSFQCPKQFSSSLRSGTLMKELARKNEEMKKNIFDGKLMVQKLDSIFVVGCERKWFLYLFLVIRYLRYKWKNH